MQFVHCIMVHYSPGSNHNSRWIYLKTGLLRSAKEKYLITYILKIHILKVFEMASYRDLQIRGLWTLIISVEWRDLPKDDSFGLKMLNDVTLRKYLRIFWCYSFSTRFLIQQQQVLDNIYALTKCQFQMFGPKTWCHRLSGWWGWRCILWFSARLPALSPEISN